jgi:diguanylate cyclase (GGDEF)-like protein
MSLRVRILLLILAAVVLPALAMFWLLLGQREQTEIQAREQLSARADAIANDLDDKVAGTAQLLFGLGRVPVLASRDKTACSNFLADVLKEHPQYTGLLTILPNGQLHCDSLLSGRTLKLQDRQYFQRAIAGTQYVVEPVFGRLTGKGVLQIAYPVRAPGGALLYVLLASFDLDKYARTSLASAAYRNMSLQIWDSSGNTIARAYGSAASPDAPADPALEHETATRLLGSQPGTTLTQGTGPTARIWAATVLPRSPDAGLRLGLSLPEAGLYEQIDRKFRRALGGLIALSVLLFVAAAAFGELAIRRQTARVMSAISRLDQGAYDTPIGRPYPRGELGAVMAALDRLAQALGTQRAEISRSNEALERQANFDSLTGLANRNLLNTRLDQALMDARRAKRIAAVLVLDLDRFKTVNDSLGHSRGDLMLQETARRLTYCVRRGDTVARLGGDEFAVVLADMADIADAIPLAQQILDVLCQPIRVEGQEIAASTSLGISCFPMDGETGEVLLRNADTAMYRAKELGGNALALFTMEMNQSVNARLQTEAGLRHALENRELVLHFQPIVDLSSGRIKSAEALVRWQHPVHGLVPPAQFIAVAEESGLIIPIGDWVLREACMQARSWLDRGLAPVQVAVNLSARQFTAALLFESIEGALKSSGCPASALQLEITESMVMQDAQGALAILHQLKAMGVQCSIDDFGTGYSSLSYLKRLPVQKLKIDRSFISDIETDENDRAIVDAIQTLAKKLGVLTVAEGVETEAQLDILRKLGCDAYQGYLFARPCPSEQFAQILRRNKADRADAPPVL